MPPCRGVLTHMACAKNTHAQINLLRGWEELRPRADLVMKSAENLVSRPRGGKSVKPEEYTLYLILLPPALCFPSPYLVLDSTSLRSGDKLHTRPVGITYTLFSESRSLRKNKVWFIQTKRLILCITGVFLASLGRQTAHVPESPASHTCIEMYYSPPATPERWYTEKNLLVNFTFFIRKFIIFIVTLGHTQNVGFLLF